MTNNELKERVNHIERELEQIKQQLKPDKKITLKEFWESKQGLAIHCDTEEKAKTLLSAFDKMGKKWDSEEAYSTNTCWQNYRSKTVYYNDNTYGYLEYAIDENVKVYEFEEVDLTIPKEYQFTEDEKTILRNLDKKWKWIARDMSGALWLCKNEPKKEKYIWHSSFGNLNFVAFNHQFQSIQWTDDKPVEIAKTIGE